MNEKYPGPTCHQFDGDLNAKRNLTPKEEKTVTMTLQIRHLDKENNKSVTVPEEVKVIIPVNKTK